MHDLFVWGAPWTGRAVMLLSAAVGGLVAWRCWWGRRSDGPECSQCGYSLVGLISTLDGERRLARCPECGFDYTTRLGRVYLRRRRWLAAVVLLIGLGPTIFHHARLTYQQGWEYWLTFGPGYWLFPERLVHHDDYPPYEVCYYANRAVSPTSANLLVINYRGEQVYRYKVDSKHSQLSSYGWESMMDILGVDWTNTGWPNYGFMGYTRTGNSAVSIRFITLELREANVSELLSVTDPHADHWHAMMFFNVADQDGDGVYEVDFPDATLCAMPGLPYVAEQAHLRVYFDLQNGVYQLSTTRPEQGTSIWRANTAPRYLDLNPACIERDGLPSRFPTEQTYVAIAELIDFGRWPEGEQLIARAFGEYVAEGEAFKIAFLKHLSTSQWYDYYRELSEYTLPTREWLDAQPLDPFYAQAAE